MKVKLKFRYLYADNGFEYTGIYALVSWPLLEPYWVKDDFVGRPDRSKLSGYLKQWFSDDRFDPAFICWCNQRHSVSFINGRHRVALISKHQDDVPVILSGEAILQPEIHRAVIKILTPDDEVEIPDLSFVHSKGRVSMIKDGISPLCVHEEIHR